MSSRLESARVLASDGAVRGQVTRHGTEGWCAHLVLYCLCMSVSLERGDVYTGVLPPKKAEVLTLELQLMKLPEVSAKN